MSFGTADKGAHFYRCDLQVHTPRDAQWKGQRAVTDGEREAYATEFVAACRTLGLGAVAITDHHDLLFAPLIRAAAESEVDAEGNPFAASKKLVVFPGMELTLALARQALLVLDADFPDDRLPGVLEALAMVPSDPDVSSLPDVVALDHITSLTDLHRKLDERAWLRGRYIILPNVTDSGYKTIMRKGMHAEYKDMPCVGGYVDGSFDKTGTGNRTIFKGRDAAYGNKALAVLQTSDSRNRNFSSLGKFSTWIKWARPTAEALRQACLSRQSRISHVAPQTPNVFISGVQVSNSSFLGPFEVALNPQYNTIIGGRGTGKSTILDYIRWALCDQAADAGSEEIGDPSVRRRRLVKATLEPVAGQVEVSFTINQIPHIVRRSAANGELLLKVGGEAFARAREADIRALLPIHAYSQKQLSSVALRVDELTRFVTAPIQQYLEDLDIAAIEIAGRLRENYATLQRVRDLENGMTRATLLATSLAEQAMNLRSSLTDLSEVDREVLHAKPALDQVRETMAAEASELDAVEAAGQAFSARVDRAVAELRRPLEAPESMAAAVNNLRRERVRLLERVGAAIDGALIEVAAALTEESAEATARSTLNALTETFDVGYEEVTGRSSAHEARLSELAQVEGRRKAAAEQATRLERERRDLGGPAGVHATLRTQLVTTYIQRSGLLDAECERVTTLSAGLLKATLSRGQGLTSIGQKFRSMIQGSSVRGARVDALFENLRSESDPLTTWEEVLGELENLLLLGEEGGHTSELTPTLTRLEFTLSDQQRIRAVLTTDAWLDLALTAVKDEPIFEYQTKESEFIAFSSASAGQQATALLKVLLSQRGMPLLIDQPEEDLDNQVIQNVVTDIWQAKKGRQLIFTSHNANLVVNGDAELVVACDYRQALDQSGGQIKLEGAIDIPEVCEEITRVMEGGEKAFRLRKEKYGF